MLKKEFDLKLKKNKFESFNNKLTVQLIFTPCVNELLIKYKNDGFEIMKLVFIITQIKEIEEYFWK